MRLTLFNYTRKSGYDISIYSEIFTIFAQT